MNRSKLETNQSRVDLIKQGTLRVASAAPREKPDDPESMVW